MMIRRYRIPIVPTANQVTTAATATHRAADERDILAIKDLR